MRLPGLAVLVACACGRVGFDPLVGADAAGASPSDAVGACPPDYVRLEPGTSCYRRIDVSVSWLQAEQFCEIDAPGGHLAIIEDAAEATRLLALLTPGGSDWIGVTDRLLEGSYLGVTGAAATYLAWEPGNPGGLTQDCLQLYDSGLLGDADCASTDELVCELDGTPADPSAY